jgi:hypothetical protein
MVGMIRIAFGLVFFFAALPVLAEWKNQSESDGTGGRSCFLQTEQQSVFDGYHDSLVQVKVTPKEVLVIANSPIDKEFGDIGIEVDTNSFIPMENLADRFTSQYVSSYSAIVAQFTKGRQLRVQLRFWPEWPTTGPHSTTFSLSGFTKAYNAMKSCYQ